jgi:hypothetical protein
MPGSLRVQFHPEAEPLLSILEPASLQPGPCSAWGPGGPGGCIGQSFVNRSGPVEHSAALLFRVLRLERFDAGLVSVDLCKQAQRHAECFEVWDSWQNCAHAGVD